MERARFPRHVRWEGKLLREGQPLRVVTASEMREIDRKAIEEFGVPSLDLMERAGGGAAQVIAAIGLDPEKPVVILCGKGNNGGDGFVAARHLRQFGADVVCWMMGERDEMTSDALRNLVAAEESGVRIRSFRVDENEAELAEDLAKCQYAVDAMLGTGAKGALRDPIRRLTHLMNDSEARTFAKASTPISAPPTGRASRSTIVSTNSRTPAPASPTRAATRQPSSAFRRSCAICVSQSRPFS